MGRSWAWASPIAESSNNTERTSHGFHIQPSLAALVATGAVDQIGDPLHVVDSFEDQLGIRNVRREQADRAYVEHPLEEALLILHVVDVDHFHAVRHAAEQADLVDEPLVGERVVDA